MIPKECKRLAEVDFPIAVVSQHAAREKSIRHGHPSTLHLWWARRPLASCRAVLLGLLLPDPCDAHCPKEFKTKARELLKALRNVGPKDEDLRRQLLKFIGEFANWDAASDQQYLKIGRGLVQAAHPEETPLVVDPFAGGGSIPLEALRLECEAFASDLNPVACLILKVLLEDIPRHGPQLAEDLRKAGAEIKDAAEKELAEYYPVDPDGARPIAYLWARTVRCESPNCGAEIPLARSFWLCKKANRRRALRWKVIRTGTSTPYIGFEIFHPKSESEVPKGTVARAKATCPSCGTVLPPDRVRFQLSAQKGGADVIFDERGKRLGGARLLAVVTLRQDETGRHYRLPNEQDYQSAWKAQQRLQTILETWEQGGRKGLCPVPDEPTPAGGGSGAGRAFSVQKYGMMKFGDLFTYRQRLALVNLSRSIMSRDNEALRSLGMPFGRACDYLSSLASWVSNGEFIRSTFGRHALPMIWDFAECAPLADGSGNFDGAVEWSALALGNIPLLPRVGQVQQANAMESPLPDSASHVWFTDPPYYDAIPYSDLSDFFLAWQKRLPFNHLEKPDPFDGTNQLSPKISEAVQDETRFFDGKKKDRAFFERAMGSAFTEGRRVLSDDGIGSVVFAHKTTEGWEALLTGMIAGGWMIMCSWPIATERPGRLRSLDSAALETSIHLICRPRPEDAGVGDWGEVLRELPKKVSDWMIRLQKEGIRGADLVFACIGPALEIFSRFEKVETAEGREVKLAEYLEKVWEVVGRAALEQVLGTAAAKAKSGAPGGLEEDARLTALFLWTLQATDTASAPAAEASDDAEEPEDGDEDADETPSAGGKRKKGGYSLIFDVVRRFAQPLGIALPRWEKRIIEVEKGVVRLLPIAERAKQLFGDSGASAMAKSIERDPDKPLQLSLFEEETAPRVRGRKGNAAAADLEWKKDTSATTLDRVHAAMLLQANGQANALRALIKAEIDRGPEFLRLANALSALYPKNADEKRLLDAMLLAVPR
ncbi:MAG TPA: DUF1156 domain-containing protein [Candidatus Ozemobacteraceae bacterium]|nr:DUF1156 domain-containing protein [Candidatus Ozemobacteraceae bacterium]